MSPMRHIDLRWVKLVKIVVNQHVKAVTAETSSHSFRLFSTLCAGHPNDQAAHDVLAI